MFLWVRSSLALVSLAGLVSAQCQNRNSLDWKAKPTFASGLKGHVAYNGLNVPRGIKFDDQWNLLVIEKGVGVIALTEKQDGSCNGWEKSVVVQNGDFNHGLEYDPASKKLYASTDDIAYEYNYDSTTKTISGSPRTIIIDMRNKTATTHGTRTLQLQLPYLIAARGSSSNLDPTSKDLQSGTAQIRRFNLNGPIPDGGYIWQTGELLGHGLRNSVGLTLSADGSKLWTVENSADELAWKGNDVHIDNPAEEVNLIDLKKPGGFYGYPSCFTVFNADPFKGGSFKVGDQFSIDNNTLIDDNWCQANAIKPTLGLQAHSAPLDIKFFSAPQGNTSYTIDKSWNGHAFVSFHGSWDRDPPTGYGVIRIPWNGDSPVAPLTDSKGYSFVVQAEDMAKCPGSCIRPVGIQFDWLGRMFVSSDATGEIFIVEDVNAPGNAGQKATLSVAMMLLPILAVFFI